MLSEVTRQGLRCKEMYNSFLVDFSNFFIKTNAIVIISIKGGCEVSYFE